VRILFALLLVLPAAARADTVSAVPRAESWLEADSARVESEERPGRMDIGVSVWSPRSDSAPSRVPGTTAFGTSIPEFQAGYVFPPFAEGRWGSLAFSGGAGVARLGRSADGVAIAGVTRTGHQDLYLIPARTGVEWLPRGSRAWEPRVSLSALPTFGIATASALDDGGTHFGVPIELGAKVAWAPGWALLASSLTERGKPVLTLGAALRAGRVDWIDVLGVSADAGLSFRM
jgi:hypothetical protein